VVSATKTTKRKYAPRLPPEERKEQLLDTALEIIALEGYPAVSIDAIARSAGVSRPVVYGVWPDLDTLLTDLHRRQEGRAMSQVAEAIPPGPGDLDPDELLVASFRRFLEAVAGDPLTWRLFLLPIEGMPAAVARRAERTRAALRGQVTQLVAWGVDQRGGPAGLDNELMAHFLLSTGEDAGRLVLSDPERFPPSLLADNLAAVLGALARKP
jgi:AcrR family transcriptional regulator